MSIEQPIRVIIANDQELVAQMWQRVVNNLADMECPACAYNGEQAVALTLEHQPDVVVMDVMMPGMDGLEATRWIMQQSPHTKVVICSARPDIKDAAVSVGAVEVLSMPLLPDILISTIRKVVNQY